MACCTHPVPAEGTPPSLFLAPFSGLPILVLRFTSIIIHRSGNPVFRHSFASIYYTKHKPRNKNGGLGMRLPSPFLIPSSSPPLLLSSLLPSSPPSPLPLLPLPLLPSSPLPLLSSSPPLLPPLLSSSLPSPFYSLQYGSIQEQMC